MIYESELYHHGILGQKWGKKNGPPYPLGSGSHSVSEKKAGWKRSLDKSSSNDDNEKKGFHLTDKQKKAIKIGAAAVGTALLAYGVYKLSKDPVIKAFINSGKEIANSSPINNKLYTDVADASKNLTSSLLDTRFPKQFSNIKKLGSLEPIEKTLNVVNPFKGDKIPSMNCMSCSLATFFRRMGFDAYATDVYGFNLSDAVKSIFSGYKKTDGSLIDDDLNTRSSVSNALLKAFGNNASGIMTIKWKDADYGHAFNWETNNGVVSFMDGQSGRSDSQFTDNFFSRIDTTIPVSTVLYCLSDSQINFDELKRYISGK